MSLPLSSAHVRIARSTNNIEALKPFYIDGLGSQVLYEFKGHDGFDGIMLGLESAGIHFEFTRKEGHDAGRAPTQDKLTVFYLPSIGDWTDTVKRMQEAGHEPVAAFNPYWDVRGKTFEDPDGYRVVLQNADWSNKKL